MIVRTYDRRSNSYSRRNNNNRNSFILDDTDEFNDNSSQNSPHELQNNDDILNFPFTSQESTKNPYNLDSFDSFDSDPYSFDSCEDLCKMTVLPSGSKRLKTELSEKRNEKKVKEEKQSVVVNETTTLMETQEFGEMMEHVDEVEFALDGLRREQPVRIRKASLSSLLSVCGSLRQLRLVRTHG